MTTTPPPLKLEKIKVDRIRLTCGHNVHVRPETIATRWMDGSAARFWCDKCDKDRAIVSAERIEQTVILD